MGLFPGDNQYHIVCFSTEHTASRRLLTGVRPVNCYRKQIYWGICGDRGGADSVVGVEGGGVTRFGGHHGRGGGKAPTDHLRGPVEVPPSRVVFCIARHPGHRDGIPDHRGCAAEHVTTGPL